MTPSKLNHLVINGRPVSVPEGSTVLDAIEKAQLKVPTLCNHPAVPASGACRACTVSIKDAKGKTTLTTACSQPAEHGMQIDINSEEAQTVRKTVFQLLMARNPDVEIVRSMAFEWGVYDTPYEISKEPDTCIRCGLCVRICKQVGTEAIDFVNRGADVEVAPPFLRMPPDCIGCASCHAICPTGYITLEDTNTQRTIWDRKFQRVPCKICGVPTTTVEQRDYLMKKTGLNADYFEVCAHCKEEQSSQTFANITQAKITENDSAQALAEQSRKRLEMQLSINTQGK